MNEQQTTSVAAYDETVRLAFAIVLPAVVAFSGLLHAAPRTPVYGYRIIHTYPHDRSAFTQGLEYRAGFLYEGTGLNGRSSLRKVELETGRVLQEIRLDQSYFGEGITLLDRRIIQLTWQNHRGFVYDPNTFRLIRNFDYPGEGWGLTNDGRQIFMSDGTAEIRCWRSSTFEETRRFTVRDGTLPIESLNELEYVRGEIFANVYQTNRIARIIPADGRVSGWIDLSGLLPPTDLAAGADVLNGIAYDSLGDRLFVTGKLWPRLFEIQLVRQ